MQKIYPSYPSAYKIQLYKNTVFGLITYYQGVIIRVSAIITQEENYHLDCIFNGRFIASEKQESNLIGFSRNNN